MSLCADQALYSCACVQTSNHFILLEKSGNWRQLDPRGSHWADQVSQARYWRASQDVVATGETGILGQLLDRSSVPGQLLEGTVLDNFPPRGFLTHKPLSLPLAALPLVVLLTRQRQLISPRCFISVSSQKGSFKYYNLTSLHLSARKYEKHTDMKQSLWQSVHSETPVSGTDKYSSKKKRKFLWQKDGCIWHASWSNTAK